MSNQTTSTKPREKVNQVRPRPIGGTFGFFGENLEANNERALEPTTTTCLQGPGFIDFNTSHEVSQTEAVPSNEITGGGKLANASEFTSWQVIKAPLGDALSSVGGAAVGTVKESAGAIGSLLGQDFFGLGAKKIEKNDKPESPEDQAKKIEDQARRQAFMRELMQSPHHEVVPPMINLDGKAVSKEEFHKLRKVNESYTGDIINGVPTENAKSEVERAMAENQKAMETKNRRESMLATATSRGRDGVSQSRQQNKWQENRQGDQPG